MGTMTFDGKKLYKVLVGGRSCHGGDMVWSLPVQNPDGTWTPGAWHEVKDPSLCNRGLHLTWEPIKWAKEGLEVYEVEADEIADSAEGDRKVVCGRCRLLSRVVDAGALAALCIVTTGVHAVKEGNWFASGSASVTASGSASVTASGSATVDASGSASVTASGSATVDASGSATVRAYDSASVTAFGRATVDAYDSASVTASGSASVTATNRTTVDASGSATVRAYDSASVTASGSATVRAYDSATVRAYDSATVRAYDSASVKATNRTTVISLPNANCGVDHHPNAIRVVTEQAIHIDRRQTNAVIRTADIGVVLERTTVEAVAAE